jgi:hypothetical protein
MGGGYRLKSPVPDLPTRPESGGLGVMGAEPDRRAVQELVQRGPFGSVRLREQAGQVAIGPVACGLPLKRSERRGGPGVTIGNAGSDAGGESDSDGGKDGVMVMSPGR